MGGELTRIPFIDGFQSDLIDTGETHMDVRFATQGTKPNVNSEDTVHLLTVEMRIPDLAKLQRATVPSLLNDEDLTLIQQDPGILERDTVTDLSTMLEEEGLDDLDDEEDFWRTSILP